MSIVLYSLIDIGLIFLILFSNNYFIAGITFDTGTKLWHNLPG